MCPIDCFEKTGSDTNRSQMILTSYSKKSRGKVKLEHHGNAASRIAVLRQYSGNTFFCRSCEVLAALLRPRRRAAKRTLRLARKRAAADGFRDSRTGHHDEKSGVPKHPTVVVTRTGIEPMFSP